MTDLSHVARPAGSAIIHARKSPGAAALCGAPPGTPYTTTRRYVTCEGCKATIAARLAAKRPSIL